MSRVVAAPPDGLGATSTDPTGRQVWRAAKGPLLVGLAVLVAGLLLALVSGGGGSRPLDPRSAAPGGARALAEVLRGQGVRVELVTTSAAVARTARRGDTLLVAAADLLADSQVRTVRATGADLVLAGTVLPQRWVPGVTVSAAQAGVRTPACRLRAARRAGAAAAGTLTYAVGGTALARAARCYPVAGQPSLVVGRVDGVRLTFAGSITGLANERLADDGNAALALGLLGRRPRLVWYLPSPGDVPQSARRSFYALVPDGVWWGLGQLAVALLLLGLWRARRLGPVVPETLPVVVRAAETVEGRGRLYRRAHARDRAAALLRAGARSRLVPVLGLPRRAEPAAVVAAVADRSGRPAAAVGALLYGAAPADDAALVRLAAELDAVETEVRRP